jgi:hypothetical protein
MDLQELEKMINTYLNEVESYGEEGEYDEAEGVLTDFLLYFKSEEELSENDFSTWDEEPYDDEE